jgi:hypothetical protein
MCVMGTEMPAALSLFPMTIWPTKDRVYVDGIDCPCRIQYGVDNGGMENDYITVAREDNGKWLTARIDQIRSAPNPTLDIEDFSVA